MLVGRQIVFLNRILLYTIFLSKFSRTLSNQLSYGETCKPRSAQIRNIPQNFLIEGFQHSAFEKERYINERNSPAQPKQSENGKHTDMTRIVGRFHHHEETTQANISVLEVEGNEKTSYEVHSPQVSPTHKAVPHKLLTDARRKATGTSSFEHTSGFVRNNRFEPSPNKINPFTTPSTISPLRQKSLLRDPETTPSAELTSQEVDVEQEEREDPHLLRTARGNMNEEKLVKLPSGILFAEHSLDTKVSFNKHLSSSSVVVDENVMKEEHSSGARDTTYKAIHLSSEDDNKEAEVEREAGEKSGKRKHGNKLRLGIDANATATTTVITQLTPTVTNNLESTGDNGKQEESLHLHHRRKPQISLRLGEQTFPNSSPLDNNKLEHVPAISLDMLEINEAQVTNTSISSTSQSPSSPLEVKDLEASDVGENVHSAQVGIRRNEPVFSSAPVIALKLKKRSLEYNTSQVENANAGLCRSSICEGRPQHFNFGFTPLLPKDKAIENSRPPTTIQLAQVFKRKDSFQSFHELPRRKSIHSSHTSPNSVIPGLMEKVGKKIPSTFRRRRHTYVNLRYVSGTSGMDFNGKTTPASMEAEQAKTSSVKSEDSLEKFLTHRHPHKRETTTSTSPSAGWLSHKNPVVSSIKDHNTVNLEDHSTSLEMRGNFDTNNYNHGNNKLRSIRANHNNEGYTTFPELAENLKNDNSAVTQIQSDPNSETILNSYISKIQLESERMNTFSRQFPLATPPTSVKRSTSTIHKSKGDRKRRTCRKKWISGGTPLSAQERNVTPFNYEFFPRFQFQNERGSKDEENLFNENDARGNKRDDEGSPLHSGRPSGGVNATLATKLSISYAKVGEGSYSGFSLTENKKPLRRRRRNVSSFTSKVFNFNSMTDTNREPITTEKERNLSKIILEENPSLDYSTATDTPRNGADVMLPSSTQINVNNIPSTSTVSSSHSGDIIMSRERRLETHSTEPSSSTTEFDGQDFDDEMTESVQRMEFPREEEDGINLTRPLNEDLKFEGVSQASDNEQFTFQITDKPTSPFPQGISEGHTTDGSLVGTTLNDLEEPRGTTIGIISTPISTTIADPTMENSNVDSYSNMKYTTTSLNSEVGSMTTISETSSQQASQKDEIISTTVATITEGSADDMPISEQTTQGQVDPPSLTTVVAPTGSQSTEMSTEAQRDLPSTTGVASTKVEVTEMTTEIAAASTSTPNEITRMESVVTSPSLNVLTSTMSSTLTQEDTNSISTQSPDIVSASQTPTPSTVSASPTSEFGMLDPSTTTTPSSSLTTPGMSSEEKISSTVMPPTSEIDQPRGSSLMSSSPSSNPNEAAMLTIATSPMPSSDIAGNEEHGIPTATATTSIQPIPTTTAKPIIESATVTGTDVGESPLQCDEMLELVCSEQTEKCVCKSGMMYNDEEMKCLPRVGSECFGGGEAQSKMPSGGCPLNAECKLNMTGGQSGICRCIQGYASTTEKTSCLPAWNANCSHPTGTGNMGNKCHPEFDCSVGEAGGKCVCKANHTIGIPHEAAERNSISSNRDGNGEELKCFLDYGSQCDLSDDKCNDFRFLKCSRQSNKCECADSDSQLYDTSSQQCVARAGAKCDMDGQEEASTKILSCIGNSTCVKFGNESIANTGTCKCIDTFDSHWQGYCVTKGGGAMSTQYCNLGTRLFGICVALISYVYVIFPL